jgi:hypothetical protein
LCGQVGPGIFGNLDSAVVCVAAPVANSLMLHVVLSTEPANIFGMLGDFHLLDGLTQRGTVIGAVLAYDSNLLGVHGHVYLLKSSQEKPC